YLGIPFNAKGIDTSRLIQHNTAKTTNAMHMLHSIDAQQYSFGLGVSLRLYRTFIRPVMEYGLAIAKLTAALKTQLERTQQRCVRLALNVTDVTATTPTIIPLHLAALPDMSLRATILQFKFVRRAHELPPTTLLASVVDSLLRRQQLDREWLAMTRNKLWVEYKQALHSPNPPRYPMKHTIRSHLTKELETRRQQFPSVARALPERRWDPILFLPASSQARHRLVKWRMHWLPSFPLKKCRCGVSGKTPN
ncbi:hypothetical protein BJV82DRAFT_525617, partial [Fennellomyces sp. T-0311]